MEQIKKILKPGGNKDDEVMYGDKETRLRESRGNPTHETVVAPASGTENVKQGGVLNQITNPDGSKYEEQKYHPVAQTGKDTSGGGGVLGQITNPDGNKYDEERFDERSRNASIPSSTPTAVPTTGGVIHPNEKLETRPEAEKEHGVLRQLLNPGQKKRDDIAFGSTAEPVTGEPRQLTGKSTGGVMSQLTNPDGNKYDEQRFDASRTTGPIPTTVPATGGVIGANTTLETKPEAEKEPGVLKQLLNPGQKKRDDIAFGSTAEATHSGTPGVVGSSAAGTAAGSTIPVGSTTTTQTLPDRTAPTTTSHLGRDTAILGTGAAVGTGAGVAAASHNEPHGSVLDRSHPLRDGTGSTADHINPVGAPAVTQSSAVSQPNVVSTYGTSGADRGVDSHINPVGAPVTHSTLGTGTSAAPATTGLSSYNDNSNFGRDTGLVGAAGLAGAGAATGAAHTHSHGSAGGVNHPHGQHLDCDGNPVPGYVHHTSGPHSTDIANQLDPKVAAGPPLVPINAQSAHVGTSHLGRDAAVVGGAGAVGAGAYAATTHNTTTTTTTTTHGTTVGHTPASYGGTNPAIDPAHGAGLSQTRTTYGGTHPEIDRKHEGVVGGHTTYGGTHPEIGRKHEAAPVGAAAVYGSGNAILNEEHEQKLREAREKEAEKGGDHGDKKPSLIQKILHPHGKEDKHDKHDKLDKHGKHESDVRDRHHDHIRADRDIQEGSALSSGSHEHSHVKTTVDEKGHTKLHKDPPASHPAAQAGVAGPDWDAVNQANRTS